MAEIEFLDGNTAAALAIAAGLAHSIVRWVLYTQKGRIVSVSTDALEMFGVKDVTHVTELASAEMARILLLEAELVLNSLQPLQYVAETGEDSTGRHMTSRCSEWSPEHQSGRLVYIETVPVSSRRQMVMRLFIPLTPILQTIRDRDFTATITQKTKGPR